MTLNDIAVQRNTQASSMGDMCIPGDTDHASAFKTRVQKLLAHYQQQYKVSNPKSADTFSHASKSLAGGNTRTAIYYEPFPMVLVSGRDCYVTSEDGREYIDFVSEYSACMLGHSHPDVADAVHQVMSRGINLGGASKEEQILAANLTDRIPSMQKVRFCNSGTEANTMAITLAKHSTGRSKILAFEKGYHGGFIGFNHGILPTTVPFEFVLARYDDESHVRELVDESFAAIIVEPMQSVGGMIPASRQFLQVLREVADRTGALLIFDEVVTSRLHYNALQSYHQVFPDLTTVGKFWGGGFSFGAFGGKAEIMAAMEPPGTGESQKPRLSHSGTFNNNAFSMTAGAVACRLITKEAIATANALGDRLREGINAAGRVVGPSPWMWATGIGSMMTVHFSGLMAGELLGSFFFFMLERGFYVAPRGLIALNIMHTDQHVSLILQAVQSFSEEFQTSLSS